MKETIRAAFVIARRDLSAVIFSKAFIFFLMGPLFPILIGIGAGTVGSQVNKDIAKTVFAIAMPQDEAEKLLSARQKLVKSLGGKALPELAIIPPEEFAGKDSKQLLNHGERPYTAIISGRLEKPVLTGAAQDVNRWRKKIALISETALSSPQSITVETSPIGATKSAKNRDQLDIAQNGQIILIILTMILAGMVLSNLVEEKTNKIIEVLAAAVPMDSIFLGKLFAMLAMALIGISFWSALGFIAFFAFSPGLPASAVPAVGWPIFCALMVIYFSMAYLLLGSLFLGIGAMATTIRQVQTLSMPLTMAQLLVFFIAALSLTKLGEPIELFAVAFPLSSPFAMIARAAQMDNIWQHGVALLWQISFTLLIIRISTRLFRRNVLNSSGPKKSKKLFANVRPRSRQNI